MENFTDSTLEGAMIQYAVMLNSTAYKVFGWEEFKMLYECENTADELFDKFWDEIIPNMDNYSIIERNVLAHRLAIIPNPKKQPASITPTYDNFRFKPLWKMEKEEAERKEYERFINQSAIALQERSTAIINRQFGIQSGRDESSYHLTSVELTRFDPSASSNRVSVALSEREIPPSEEHRHSESD